MASLTPPVGLSRNDPGQSGPGFAYAEGVSVMFEADVGDSGVGSPIALRRSLLCHHIFFFCYDHAGLKCQGDRKGSLLLLYTSREADSPRRGGCIVYYPHDPESVLNS